MGTKISKNGTFFFGTPEVEDLKATWTVTVFRFLPALKLCLANLLTAVLYVMLNVSTVRRFPSRKYCAYSALTSPEGGNVMSSLKQFLDIHERVIISKGVYCAITIISMHFVAYCAELRRRVCCRRFSITFMVFVITSGSLHTADCSGLQEKDALTKPPCRAPFWKVQLSSSN
jgi:hypothetical protein